MRTPEQREYQRLYAQRRRAASPELRQRHRDYAKARYWKDPATAKLSRKKARLKFDYGITWEQFNDMIAAQGGKCGVCGVMMGPPARVEHGSAAITVDHCHKTGKVRGLLCYSCNLGLGMFNDDLTRVRAAVAYLEKSTWHDALIETTKKSSYAAGREAGRDESKVEIEEPSKD